MVTVYASAKALAYLGNALVWSLDCLDIEDDGTDALDSWVCMWREISEQNPDLSLAARLFGVGARYLQTKDERVLLDLVQEERAILRDLFGLNGEDDKR